MQIGGNGIIKHGAYPQLQIVRHAHAQMIGSVATLNVRGTASAHGGEPQGCGGIVPLSQTDIVPSVRRACTSSVYQSTPLRGRANAKLLC